MNRQFFVLWYDGERRWDGPFDEIGLAKAAVPADSGASMIVVPLAAMTPAEKREALPILEGRPR